MKSKKMKSKKKVLKVQSWALDNISGSCYRVVPTRDDCGVWKTVTSGLNNSSYYNVQYVDCEDGVVGRGTGMDQYAIVADQLRQKVLNFITNRLEDMDALDRIKERPGRRKNYNGNYFDIIDTTFYIKEKFAKF